MPLMLSINQGTRIWYLCYHSTKYPITNFVHLDNEPDISHGSMGQFNFQEEPNANSTLINPGQHSQTCPSMMPLTENVINTPIGTSALNNMLPGNKAQYSVTRNEFVPSECLSAECSLHSVGHSCHIPRTPPSPTTYTIPSIMNKSVATDHNNGDMFGMIKLGDNDVCYTSGSIEWVGRKRSFPINSGFKKINSSFRQGSEPNFKRVKRLDTTFTIGVNKIKECDCADVLPTVNAIVDHLNALHEAVDIIDLRLDTLEDVITKNDK